MWHICIKQNIRENKKVKQTIATMIKENFSDSREEYSYKVLQFSAFKTRILAKKCQMILDWTRKCWILAMKWKWFIYNDNLMDALHQTTSFYSRRFFFL